MSVELFLGDEPPDKSKQIPKTARVSVGTGPPAVKSEADDIITSTGHEESVWIHSMCLACWYTNNPEREPVRLFDRDEETCCWCGKTHHSGIYVHTDPELVPSCQMSGSAMDEESDWLNDHDF